MEQTNGKHEPEKLKTDAPAEAATTPPPTIYDADFDWSAFVNAAVDRQVAATPNPKVDWPKDRCFVLRLPFTQSGLCYVSQGTHSDRFHTTGLLREAMVFADPGECGIWLSGLKSDARRQVTPFVPVAVVFFEAHAQFNWEDLNCLADSIVAGVRQGDANDAREKDDAKKRREAALKRYQAATGKAVAGA